MAANDSEFQHACRRGKMSHCKANYATMHDRAHGNQLQVNSLASAARWMNQPINENRAAVGACIMERAEPPARERACAYMNMNLDLWRCVLVGERESLPDRRRTGSSSSACRRRTPSGAPSSAPAPSKPINQTSIDTMHVTVSSC